MQNVEVIGYLLFRARKSDRIRMMKIVQEFDITLSQFEVLHCLYLENGLPAYKIVDRLYSDSSTIMAIVDRLEMKGLVKRKVNMKDRRVNNILLTGKSKKILPKLVAEVRAYYKDLKSVLSPQENKTLSKCLIKIYQYNLKKIGENIGD